MLDAKEEHLHRLAASVGEGVLLLHHGEPVGGAFFTVLDGTLHDEELRIHLAASHGVRESSSWRRLNWAQGKRLPLWGRGPHSRACCDRQASTRGGGSCWPPRRRRRSCVVATHHDHCHHARMLILPSLVKKKAPCRVESLTGERKGGDGGEGRLQRK